MKLQPIILSESRTQLIPLRIEHCEALMKAGQASEIWRYLPLRIETLPQMLEWIEDALHQQATGTELPFAIIELSEGQIVGSTRLTDFSAPHRQVEIGWTWLSPHVWRTRINTECKYLLLRHCFEELNLQRVQLKTDARNHRSQRAIERIGGVREGVLRQHRILPDGFIRDSVMYSIIAPEWPNVKQRLEAFLARRDEPEL